MYISLDKQVVLDLLDKPIRNLKTIADTLEDGTNKLGEYVQVSPPWWDLVSLWRGGTRTKLVVDTGWESYHKVMALHTRLAAMRSVAELAESQVQVSHDDLLHVKAAKDLVDLIKVP